MKGRIHLFALCFMACLGCAHDASAHPRDSAGNYVVRVQDEAGHPLRTFRHGGETFVLGRFGERYDIRVENRSGQRIEAVVTVDGRDVISGQVGDYRGARGYLIEAYDELVIEGFRQNLSEVAAFRFTSPHDSYSSRMGTPENVGVIGVAIFPERARPQPVIAQPRPEYSRSYDDDLAAYEGDTASASAPPHRRARPHRRRRARPQRAAAADTMQRRAWARRRRTMQRSASLACRVRERSSAGGAPRQSGHRIRGERLELRDRGRVRARQSHAPHGAAHAAL